ncbi:MAG: indolepyruvate oxidoreductase subunit beta [Candidatus Omnitrophica bacterium]|nr:indolepyruvate oxidoreductase subunit beta [Candidatus Omnitrophota bacterium]
MKNNTTNILFCGTGGQGVLKAAEVTGWAAIFAGFHAKKSEVHGMAQRGGSVESHVRFGKEVFSPLIPKGEVNFLVAFHSGEEERLKTFLAPDGKSLLEFLLLAHKKGGDPRYWNTYVLGALAAHLSIPQECWIEALEHEFKTKNLADNKRVFLEGWKEVKL